MKALFVCMLAAVALVGCATHEKFDKNMASWVGRDVNEAISNWGPPSETYKAPNGNTFYTWNRSGPTTASGYQDPLTGITTVSANTSACKASFEANGIGTIVNYRWEGHACKAE